MHSGFIFVLFLSYLYVTFDPSGQITFLDVTGIVPANNEIDEPRVCHIIKDFKLSYASFGNVDVEQKNASQALADFLVTNFRKEERPLRSRLQLKSLSVRKCEGKTTWTLLGRVQLLWSDKRLSWNPEDYGGVQFLPLNRTDLSVSEYLIWHEGKFGNDTSLESEPTLPFDGNGSVSWYFTSVLESMATAYNPFADAIQHGLSFCDCGGGGMNLSIDGATIDLLGDREWALTGLSKGDSVQYNGKTIKKYLFLKLIFLKNWIWNLLWLVPIALLSYLNDFCRTASSSQKVLDFTCVVFGFATIFFIPEIKRKFKDSSHYTLRESGEGYKFTLE